MVLLERQVDQTMRDERDKVLQAQLLPHALVVLSSPNNVLPNMLLDSSLGYSFVMSTYDEFLFFSRGTVHWHMVLCFRQKSSVFAGKSNSMMSPKRQESP